MHVGLRDKAANPTYEFKTLCCATLLARSQRAASLLDSKPAGRIGGGVNQNMSNDDIEERFFVHGRMEILDLLNDLILRQQPVNVSFNAGQDGFATTLLEARHKALIFDPAAEAGANLALLACRACTFIAHPDGIRVQFAGRSVRRLSWGGADALCVRLPDKVARLQRQESFRILIPAAQVLAVRLFSADGTALGEWPLHDLSIGGLGISAGELPRLESGQVIARVQLALPDHAQIDCPATPSHVTSVADADGNLRYRIGLAFSALPPAMRATIQRYIIQVEHARRTAASENAAAIDDV